MIEAGPDGMRHNGVYRKTVAALSARAAEGRAVRFVSLRGGTRSGKTITLLQLLYKLSVVAPEKTLTSIVSATFPHLKRGAIRDLPTALGDVQYRDAQWSRSRNTYTVNGSEMEFFSADSKDKVHGPARDYLMLNEAQNIPKDTARQLFVRTRGTIFLDYNPTRKFWIDEIEAREDCVTVVSTYKDNLEFLTEDQIREIESYRNDKYWWAVYGEGRYGVATGLILPDHDIVSSFPEAREGMVECYGLDFGYSVGKTACVRVLLDRERKEAWIREVCYALKMRNDDIARALMQDGCGGLHVWADCAEPKSIAEIKGFGVSGIRPCSKSAPRGSDRLSGQLHWLSGWKLHIVMGSDNVCSELDALVWKKNDAGDSLPTPDPRCSDHAVDALRYAIYDECAGVGDYMILYN